MSIDERIFGWISARLMRARRPDPVRLARAAQSAPRLGRLKMVASALAGAEVQAAVVDGPGGIAGRVLLLPRVMDLAPDEAGNERALVLLAAFCGFRMRAEDPPPSEAPALGQLRFLVQVGALERRLSGELGSWSQARAALGSALVAERPPLSGLSGRAAVLEALAQLRLGAELPAGLPEALRALVVEAASQEALAPPLAEAFLALGSAGTFVMPACWGERYGTVPTEAVSALSAGLPAGGSTEREGPARPPAKRRRALDQHQGPENPATHSFEKVHTAEEYRGGHKRADGSDELAEHQAALDELNLEETVLSSEATSSVYRSGTSSGEVGAATEAPPAELRYPEWDGRHQRYLAEYCRVRVSAGSSSLARGRALTARVRQEERRAIERSRAAILRVESALRWHSRQIDGQEVDLDAALERITAVAAGHEGTPRVYVSRRRSARSLAVMVLLDASMSTDGWVANRRVLDLERDAATIVALATEGLVEEIALAAFSSDTHEDCRFVELKRFEESWPVGVGRLALLEPAGYTRIGPAIRHAAAELARCRAKRRVLLLLTDGKPSDRDRYEGSHGESDVRQAIREARRDQVEVIALGADPRAAPTIASMFGPHSRAGLRRAGDVASAIVEICARRMQL